MTKVESIEKEIESLSPPELAQLRAWLLEHDWQAWDRELERDAADGVLDGLATEALDDHGRGETIEL